MAQEGPAANAAQNCSGRRLLHQPHPALASGWHFSSRLVRHGHGLVLQQQQQRLAEDGANKVVSECCDSERGAAGQWPKRRNLGFLKTRAGLIKEESNLGLESGH